MKELFSKYKAIPVAIALAVVVACTGAGYGFGVHTQQTDSYNAGYNKGYADSQAWHDLQEQIDQLNKQADALTALINEELVRLKFEKRHRQ